MSSIGVTFALLALLCWGIGDFLIQRSTRKFGDLIALFYISSFATVVLLPFVAGDLRALGWMGAEMGVLVLASAVLLVASLLDLEALRVGKISVVESAYALEVPIVAVLSAFLIQERLTPAQGILVGMVAVGVILVATKSLGHVRSVRWERGVVLACFATVAMAFVNFLFGVGGRMTDPLLINWFTGTFVAAASLGLILAQRNGRAILLDARRSWKLALSVSAIDNGAWIFYTFSMAHIPITIATGISESYIAVAALLGVIVNRERLRRHQYAGLVITILAAVGLAFLTKDVL